MTDKELQRWHPKAVRGPGGWTGSMVPAKNGDWVRASDLAALRERVARLEGALGVVSASLHQLARDRDLSEAELDFMRSIDAALTDAQIKGV